MYKVLGAFVFGVCLLAPTTTLAAQDRDHEQTAPVHQWNDNENPAWHQYLKEHRKKDHDWSKANKKEQSDYWKWRDQHRDVH